MKKHNSQIKNWIDVGNRRNDIQNLWTNTNWRKQPDWSIPNEKYPESELSRTPREGAAHVQLCLQRSKRNGIEFLIAPVLLTNKKQQAADFKSPMEDKTNSVIKPSYQIRFLEKMSFKSEAKEGAWSWRGTLRILLLSPLRRALGQGETLQAGRLAPGWLAKGLGGREGKE